MDNTTESEAYLMPDNIDPEGLRILTHAGFEWDPRTLAFQKRAAGRSQGSSATIEYRFLREQRLVVNSGLNESERIGQLQRLRILVQSID